MNTKVYSGNYTLQAGMPYVFITITKDESHYRIELIILFAGFDGRTKVKGRNYRFPANTDFTESNIFEHAIELAKEFILHDIILAYYSNNLSEITVPPVVLRETNHTIMMFLKKKYPEALRLVRKYTSSTWLQGRIDLYSGIQLEEVETYGDDI